MLYRRSVCYNCHGVLGCDLVGDFPKGSLVSDVVSGKVNKVSYCNRCWHYLFDVKRRGD